MLTNGNYIKKDAWGRLLIYSYSRGSEIIHYTVPFSVRIFINIYQKYLIAIRPFRISIHNGLRSEVGSRIGLKQSPTLRKYKFVFLNTTFVEKYKYCFNNTKIVLIIIQLNYLGGANTLWPTNQFCKKSFARAVP